MKTTQNLRLTRKIAVLTGIVGLSTFASAPALAQMESPQPGTEETQQPSGETSPGTSQQNLVEVASEDASFDTLVQAINAVGLSDSLSGGGESYTVFAPTDEAFDTLPKGALDVLLMPENQDLLREILRYHVVPREVTAREFSTGTVDTLNGGIAVQPTEDGLIVNSASVTKANIQASNGVIHATNRVLLSPTLRERLTAQLEAQPDTQSPSPGGMESPGGMQSPSPGMESPGGMESPEGMQSPSPGMESPGGMESPEGMQSPSPDTQQ